jgi:hypothetical protein
VNFHKLELRVLRKTKVSCLFASLGLVVSTHQFAFPFGPPPQPPFGVPYPTCIRPFRQIAATVPYLARFSTSASTLSQFPPPHQPLRSCFAAPVLPHPRAAFFRTQLLCFFPRRIFGLTLMRLHVPSFRCSAASSSCWPCPMLSKPPTCCSQLCTL